MYIQNFLFMHAMYHEYPVLENKCSLSGMDDFSRNGVVGDLRGGGG